MPRPPRTTEAEKPQGCPRGENQTRVPLAWPQKRDTAGRGCWDKETKTPLAWGAKDTSGAKNRQVSPRDLTASSRETGRASRNI